jgi:glycosyltransferase involved in cell wall biosynthesis
LKILVISNLFPPRVLGGYEILCGQVAAALEARGHRVTVLTTDAGPETGQPAPVADVRRVLRLYLDLDRPPVPARPARQRIGEANRATVRGHVRSERPDVCFVWSELRLGVGAARGAQDEGVPLLFTLNDLHLGAHAQGDLRATPRAFARWFLERFVWPDTTVAGLDLRHVTCISRCVRDDLVAQGLPIAHAKVVHQGIPVERFPAKEDPGSASAPLRVLYAGQLHAYKGVHTVLEAATILARQGVPPAVTIAGDGPAEYRARLAGLAAAAGAEVTFAGRLAHDAMPAVYREHDVLVFPSVWREPFGLTHLEAMASGTPVVSTTEGGPADFLEHGVNSLVFPKEDAVALAERIARLAGDEALRRALARTARAMVETRFSMRRYVDDLEALLREAAGGAP